MKTVVLLADNSSCPNAIASAFYLHKSYNESDVSLYIGLFSYTNGQFYRFNHSQNSFTATKCLPQMAVETQAKTKREKKRQAKKQTNVASRLLIQRLQAVLAIPTINSEVISEQTFNRLARMTRYSDGVTTFDRTALPQECVSSAQSIINYARSEISKGDSLCFMIAPNGRNQPARLMTFGHKLRYDSNNPGVYQYQHRNSNKSTSAVANFKMTNKDVLFCLCELSLCRAIIEDPQVRFFGSCYGGQTMWLALHGGLTTFKRIPTSVHKETIVFPTEDQESEHIVNVNWKGGIFLAENNLEHASSFFKPAITQNDFEYTKPRKHNTDYSHSYMMITTKQESLVRKQTHALAAPVENVDKQQYSNDYTKRFFRYAKPLQDTSEQRPEGRAGRTWGWVGNYSRENRIHGCQGHPGYHLTPYSSGYSFKPSVDPNSETTFLNPDYQENQALLFELITGTELNQACRFIAH